MSIPLLEVTPKTQNQRVPGFEVPNEDAPQPYRFREPASQSDVQELIWSAYRQIFSEHLILEEYRQLALESQLRNRQLSVREFIRALGKSDVYRREVADTNSNYRLVDITFKRFLGRATYGKDEQIAWSIVIATRGLHGFIDAVVDSDEYQQNFGDSIVPYQRRRMEGRPFNLVTPRYSDYWRIQKSTSGSSSAFAQGRQYQAGDRDLQVIRRGIPASFLNMAQGILVPQMNYQRTTDQARGVAAAYTSGQTASTHDVPPPPTVKRTNVALPYRYIPTQPKV
ncbi:MULTISPECIES: phycobilisome rod-core linker polypeptide [Trichocoleus]|uniref:Phycobilisome rod-core linker polypeptide n=1 Tax=Trichocoleus desertorum GB2-A4 TaxID=2933944 RepID=A0ABV0J6C4_9CYAN|nr:phycobilisome rod-core linker polypeptide [Trichocoleus sp. FACHB-46]MBD1863438.1 phycobilisome rod-core linker polypeptide [Trichocoleus sp. FACHB-46]